MTPPAPLLAAGLFERATSLEPKSETVLFRYAVYLDEVRSGVFNCHLITRRWVLLLFRAARSPALQCTLA